MLNSTSINENAWNMTFPEVNGTDAMLNSTSINENAWNMTFPEINGTNAMLNSTSINENAWNMTFPEVNGTDAMLNSTSINENAWNMTFPIANVTEAMLMNSTAIQTVLADYGFGVDPILRSYVWPIMSSIGIVGNGLTFMVMTQLVQSSSFYLYLAVLSLSDSGFLLIGGGFNWLVFTGIYNPFLNLAQRFCSVPFSLELVFSQFSAWITVAVTIDRYIAVCHPFKVARFCTKRRALITMTVMLIILAAVNFPIICWKWNDDNSQCILPTTTDYCLNYITVIDIGVYMVAPIFLISLFNILIVRGLYQAFKRRCELANCQPSGGTSDATNRTTIMLFAITTIFILSVIPLASMALHAFIYDLNVAAAFGALPTVHALSHTAILLNHSINFILYGATGKSFRDKFVAMCRCCRGE